MFPLHQAMNCQMAVIKVSLLITSPCTSLNGDGADIVAINDSSLCEMEAAIASCAGASCNTYNGQRNAGRHILPRQLKDALR